MEAVGELTRAVTDQPKVRLGIYEDATLLDVCSAPFAGLFKLWDAKRAGRTYPSRPDFDPIEMKPWLGRITLVEVLYETPMDFRYRLCGSRTANHYGLDLTGKRLSEACYIGTPPEAQRVMTELVRIGRVRYRNDPVTDLRGFALMRERMYLPLADDGAKIDMLLCYQESSRLPMPTLAQVR